MANKDRLSLVDFVRAKKRAGCPICELPADIRGEMVEARRKKITRAEVMEWLEKAVGVTVTPTQMDLHYSGRHDQ